VDKSVKKVSIRSKKPEENGKYVVYQVLHNGVVVYVGEGKDGRQLHAVSGTSHVYELNRLHFTCPDEVTVKVVKRFDNKADAVAYEVVMIQTLSPVYNKKHVSSKSSCSVSLPLSMNSHADKAFSNLHKHIFCHYTVSECFGGIPVSRKIPLHQGTVDVYLQMMCISCPLKDSKFLFRRGVVNNVIEWFHEDGVTYIKLHSDILKQSECDSPIKATIARHAGLPINQL